MKELIKRSFMAICFAALWSLIIYAVSGEQSRQHENYTLLLLAWIYADYKSRE